MKGFTRAGLLASLVVATTGFSFTSEFQDLGQQWKIRITAEESDFQLVPTYMHGLNMMSIESLESATISSHGEPFLPRVARLLQIDHELLGQLKVHVTYRQPEVRRNVILTPMMKDHIESEPNWDRDLNIKSYERNELIGGPDVILGQAAFVGQLPVVPLSVKMFDYNPAKQELYIYRSATITVAADQRSLSKSFLENKWRSLNGIESATLDSFVLNASLVRKYLDSKTRAQSGLLVVTGSLFSTPAKDLMALHPDLKGLVEVVPSTIKPDELKTMIDRHRINDQTDTVVFLGDETVVPFAMWDGLESDSWYTYLAGDDGLADIKLGRMPAATVDEATLLVDKLRDYVKLTASGQINKNVLLMAHGEAYPGKYTANMEAVRALKNPLLLKFTTQYGGNGGSNQRVQSIVNGGVGLVNYRGHGDFREYWNWDYQSQPFDDGQVAKLSNWDNRLTIFFNIACYTGGFQTYAKSMAEELILLTPKNSRAGHRGAVAVLGATEPSYTNQNDKFSLNLFTYLQTNDDISVGQLNLLANNKLAIDNGGRVVDNSKMYILFGDPLVRPLIK
jgi:hypothetical protein